MSKKPLSNNEGEVRELTRNDFQDMRSAKEVLPAELVKILPKRRVGQRGKQKVPAKVQMTMRYSPEVLEYFKREGEGWQNLINEALKEWIKQHPQ